MAKKDTPKWWQIPRIWAGWVAGVGATAVVVSVAASYIDLPPRMNKVEASNAEQDKILDRIVAVWEYQQQQMPNQQSYNPARHPETRYHEEQDEQGWWCCENYDGRDCVDEWYRC